MGAYMANITRIKAKDSKSSEKTSGSSSNAEISRKVSIKAKNSENKKLRSADKKAVKAKAKEIRKEKRKAEKHEIPKWLKPLWYISAPFRAIGRYFRDSFRELRQVRWPNRKLTWKMVVAVVIYAALFLILITLLDLLFDFIFKLILS